ncbi:hypothetical protein M3Y99_01522600 [Aphelenchoides fujianensis]|nr:hypothetical protein M3Y99_01522600 [Aphelenchoides fujianensis]
MCADCCGWGESMCGGSNCSCGCTHGRRSRTSARLPHLQSIGVDINPFSKAPWIVRILRDFLPCPIVRFSSDCAHHFLLFEQKRQAAVLERPNEVVEKVAVAICWPNESAGATSNPPAAEGDAWTEHNGRVLRAALANLRSLNGRFALQLSLPSLQLWKSELEREDVEAMLLVALQQSLAVADCATAAGFPAAAVRTLVHLPNPVKKAEQHERMRAMATRFFAERSLFSQSTDGFAPDVRRLEGSRQKVASVWTTRVGAHESSFVLLFFRK